MQKYFNILRCLGVTHECDGRADIIIANATLNYTYVLCGQESEYVKILPLFSQWTPSKITVDPLIAHLLCIIHLQVIASKEDKCYTFN